MRTAEDDYRSLVKEQQDVRIVIARLPLSHIFVSPNWGPMSLRWAYSHMIREYAGHNGHADLLRETILARPAQRQE